MADDEKWRDLSGQARELFRVLESERGPIEPDFLTKYAGEWVVVDRGRVIAHGTDGAEVARQAPVGEYPFAELFYVPTREEQEGVRILLAPTGRKPRP